MSPQKHKSEKLILDDVRQIVLAEGVLSRKELIVQIIWALGISGLIAWAIVAGEATVWHLLVPMVAEYIVCVVSLRLLAIIICGLSVACFVRSRIYDRSFPGQFSPDWDMARNWPTA